MKDAETIQMMPKITDLMFAGNHLAERDILRGTVYHIIEAGQLQLAHLRNGNKVRSAGPVDP
jgi:hypothetical protein